MFASGVVKLTSRCPTWWSLTALDYHYESQCIPTPLAWWFHHLPAWFQRLSVVATYVIEIPIPFLFFAPARNLRLFAFFSQCLLQLLIILTGNYNFFNLLTLTLCLSLLDDGFFGKGRLDKKETTGITASISATLRPYLHPYGSVAVYAVLFAYTVKYFDLQLNFSSSFPSVESRIAFSQRDFFSALTKVMPLTVYTGATSLLVEIWNTGSVMVKRKRRKGEAGLVGICSTFGSLVLFAFWCGIASLMFSISLIPHAVVDDTASSSIPTSLRRIYSKFEPFEITHSYGLFRRMTGVGGRPEVVIEGTNDNLDESPEWEEIEFPYKPGALERPPPVVAPHQPRLDWQMWFAALGSYQHNPWFLNLLYRILSHQPEVVSLLDSLYPFSKSPPKYVRATLYHYHYTKPSEVKDYWKREKQGSYFPIVDVNDPGLNSYLRQAGLLDSPSDNVPDILQLQKCLSQIRLLVGGLDGFCLCGLMLFIAFVSSRMSKFKK